MKPVPFFALSALLAGAVALTFTQSGCTPAKPVKETMDDGMEDVMDAPPKVKTAIKAGTGTIEGTITFSGKAPEFTKTDSILKEPNCNKCVLPTGKEYWDADQTWIVGKDGGLANVLVRLKVPADKYFEPSDADKKRTKDVILEQPCCAFDPHVLVLYPSYWDGKKLEKTGQALDIKNDAPFVHNTKGAGDAKKGNVFDYPVAPKEEKKVVLAPQADAITVNCSIHPWMSAKVFVYDHPYAFVTKIDGKYKLENVPTGVDLTVEFWHEDKGVFKTETVKLEDKGTKKLDQSIGK